MKSLNKIISLVVLAIAATVFSVQAFAQTGGKIILVDFARVQEESLVGQNVISQLTQYGNAVTARKEALEAQLNAEGAELEGQEVILPPDAFKQKVEAFQRKARLADQELQQYRQTMVRAEQNANLEITNNLKPIIRQIMSDVGADIVLDKSLVYIAGTGFDVTDRVVARLDQQVQRYELNLKAPTLEGPSN